MPSKSFSKVKLWIFDLDNTLYPPKARLFDQIEALITRYVMRNLALDHGAANRLRKQYWREHGTTLAGLMRVHDIDPVPYMNEVHDISLKQLRPDFNLRAAIINLPGRKIIYTNGPKFHAERVTHARGLGGIFDEIYGIEHADYRPKPERAAFESILAKDHGNPTSAAMFEDDARNLAAPRDMGMACVLVGPKTPKNHPYIHYQTEDLAGFLSATAARGVSPRKLGD